LPPGHADGADACGCASGGHRNQCPKIVATAHLKGALDEPNLITKSLRTAASHVPPKSTAIVTVTTESLAIPSSSHMTWNEASQALENVIAKVLSQAQAAKLIATAIQRKGIDTTRPADAATVAEIGQELTQKVPSRPIRASLEKEMRCRGGHDPSTGRPLPLALTHTSRSSTSLPPT